MMSGVQPISRETAQHALESAYGQVSELADRLDEADFMRPTRCAGWAVCDVLYHELLDARRALRTFASPSPEPADRDDIDYWRPFGAGGEAAPGSAGAAEHARHVRIAASAYRPAELSWEWRETADSALRAARACQHERVTTQGHVLRTADFIATLAVEAAVHYLDLTRFLPAARRPDPAPLRLVRRVLDGLLGAPAADGPVTISWDDETYAVKGTGRMPLTAAERSALGAQADRFPLLG